MIYIIIARYIDFDFKILTCFLMWTQQNNNIMWRLDLMGLIRYRFRHFRLHDGRDMTNIIRKSPSTIY